MRGVQTKCGDVIKRVYEGDAEHDGKWVKSWQEYNSRDYQSAGGESSIMIF